MARALRLAERGMMTTHPNPRVGCVIVRDGIIVGEGAHERAGEPHAEVHALRSAGDRARGADVYVSLEPCCHHGRTPPCTDALIAAGVARVFVATADPNPKVAGQGIQRLRAAGIEVHVGLLAAEAQRINRGFFARMMRGRPWLVLKLAMSLDARTAMASGESQWITGEAARADAHRLRAEAGAVLTGVGTVVADDPRLSARGLGEGVRQPDRIVLDTQARAPVHARVWQPGARRLWITRQLPPIVPEGVTVVLAGADAQGRIDLKDALQALARHEVNEILAECGPRLAGSLLEQGLVDEIIAYVAPKLLGDQARPLAHLPGIERLTQALVWRWVDVRQIGDDVRLILQPRTCI